MSGTITLALRTAQSGLLANQAALDTISNNIANVNTPGYSRKIVNFEQRVVNGTPAGVQISTITRRVDEGLLRHLRTEYHSLETLDAKSEYYERTQEMFGSPGDNTSISHLITSFNEAIESLSSAPDKTLQQSEAVRRAREVTLKLQGMSTTIQDLRRRADAEITTSVSEINDLTQQIENLNSKIVRNSATNSDVADLKDQRDQAVDSLSKLLDVNYYQRGDEGLIVFTQVGHILVGADAATVNHSAGGTVTPASTFAEGNFDGIFLGDRSLNNDMTADIRGGKLKGLIDLRDNILTDLQSQIDEMAAEMRDVVNLVHNRGLAFPGAQTMTGTRSFIEPATSTITYSGNDDTRVVLFDSNGDQQASTTIRTLLGGASSTINNLATQVQTWLQANGAGTASVAVTNGKLVISLNTTTRNLAFRDENASAAGSTAQDATLTFDTDGAGLGTGTTHTGFSNFFGLNDLFIDGQNENMHETNVLDSTYTTGAATLYFRDSTGLLGTLNVASGTSLGTLASNITNTITNVSATVIPDGSGVRLRIVHDNGSEMSVLQAAADTLLTDMGLHMADTGTASAIDVRSDIISSPARIARGAAQWNADKGVAGEYYTSVADETVAHALAQTLATTNSFDASGGLLSHNMTFQEYGAAIVAQNASLAGVQKDNLEFQQTLTESLQFKLETVRGVNVDEELSNLILIQQAYAAAGRLVGVIKEMFDVLDQAVQ